MKSADKSVAMSLSPDIDIPDEALGMTIAHWNKIFLCYCFSRGEGDPMQMIIRDSVLHPGDHMRGFLNWLPQQWVKFNDLVEPNWRGWDLEYRQHWRTLMEKPFTEWLWARYAVKPQGGLAPHKEIS